MKKLPLLLLTIRLLLFVSIVFLLTSCGAYLHQPMQNSKARLGQTTPITLDLQSLPNPDEKIVVAVYKFRDQTGQYKPSDNGNNWSTAVTQGATNILIKALDDSGWFIPIERENVNNLLNERKIIRSSRAQYNNKQNKKASLLPPLLYAGVIIEGGIVSYDANIVTGGAGLRYFGAGGSAQYRQDRVTIYLRAVSTSSGKILKTIYTSKTILSQAFDGGLFRFVRFGRLLEAETGFTYNEPSEMAVIEAVEKAVHSLVIEGIMDGLWDVSADEEIISKQVKAYQEEKANLIRTDIFGRDLNHRRNKIGLSLNSVALQYNGDFAPARPRAGFELGFDYSINSNIALSLNYGISGLATKTNFNTNASYGEINGIYRILPYDKVSPYIQLGGGIISASNINSFGFGGRHLSKLNVGGGMEFLLNNSLGLNFMVDHNFVLSDQLDNISSGKYNDSYWRMNLGIHFYFGQPLKSDRIFKLPKKKLDDF